MKRFFHYVGLLAASVAALTNCTKVQEGIMEGNDEKVPFELIFSEASTKTSIDGVSTSWVANDAINVFHAPAGTDLYVNDGKFVITEENLAARKFTGELASALESGSYDWYAIYPYSGKMQSPSQKDVETRSYTYIGHSVGATQKGNNNTSHMCKTLCPFYSVVKDVDASSPVHLQMHHLASFAKIEVTNLNNDPLTVTEVVITSEEDIVGSYYLNFAGEEVIYEPSGDTYVKNRAVLNVSNGEPIAKGASAYFYIPLKPHVEAAGSVFKVSVNGYEKTYNLTKDYTFHAGKMKTVGFNYDKVAEPDPDPDPEIPEGAVTVTKSISDISGNPADGTKISEFVIDDVITLNASTSGNTGKIYKSGAQWRFYQTDKGTLTISAKSGYELIAATITYNNSNNGILLFGETQIKSGQTVGLSGSSAVFSASSIDKTNGRIDITQISVTYK
ncbi:MAG: fimbrillin family protein [Candidatus Cryptobacteroides sp.]